MVMEFGKLLEVLFWNMVSTPLTNHREEDSNEKSTANLEIIESMIIQRGWSPQFPCVAVSMKNWPFEKSELVPLGCTAQQYIDREMERRRTLFENLVKNAKDATDRTQLKAFIALYCFQDNDGKDCLNVLTIKNAYWVHSGHQRTQFVFMNAYVAYLTRLETASLAKTTEAAEDIAPPDGFRLTIPTLIGTFSTNLPPDAILREIARDQLTANMAVGKQNVPKLKDAIKFAVWEMGTGAAPLIRERPFRKLFSLQDDGKENSGAMPRHAWKIAYVNWMYAGKLKFVEKIFNPPKVEINGEKNQDNPDHIKLSDVALSHNDPMCDVSVISRLIEPSLELLKAYVKRGYLTDPNNIKADKPDPVSAVEYAVANRGYAWSKEEAVDWIKSKCVGQGKGVYKPPVEAVKDISKDPKSIVEALKQTVESQRIPDAFRAFNAKFLGTPVAAGTPIDMSADLKVQEKCGVFDAVWKLDGKEKYQEMVLTLIESVTQLRDGNPPVFVEVVQAMSDMVLDAMKKPFVPPEPTVTEPVV